MAILRSGFMRHEDSKWNQAGVKDDHGCLHRGYQYGSVLISARTFIVLSTVFVPIIKSRIQP